MKISELIAELEKAMAEHGDLVVRVDTDGINLEIGDWEIDEYPEWLGGQQYLELIAAEDGEVW